MSNLRELVESLIQLTEAVRGLVVVYRWIAVEIIVLMAAVAVSIILG